MSVDERLISRVRSAGSVVGNVSAIGFVDPHFWYQSRLRCVGTLEEPVNHRSE